MSVSFCHLPFTMCDNLGWFCFSWYPIVLIYFLTLDVYFGRSVLLFDINNPESQVVKLRSKQSRTCNALAFSDNGILAAGLEKTRNDNCLHIWDVNAVVEGGNITPLSTYLPNEIVSSLEFIPRTHNVLCGSYKLLREIDTRSSVRGASRETGVRVQEGLAGQPVQVVRWTRTRSNW